MPVSGQQSRVEEAGALAEQAFAHSPLGRFNLKGFLLDFQKRDPEEQAEILDDLQGRADEAIEREARVLLTEDNQGLVRTGQVTLKMYTQGDRPEEDNSPEDFSQTWKRPGGRSRARIESFCMKEVQAALGLGLPKEHERTLRIYLSIQRTPMPFETRRGIMEGRIPRYSLIQHRMRKQKRRPPKQPGRILLRAAQLGRLSLDAQRAAAEGDCATAIELQEKLKAELGRLNRHYKQTHLYAALDRTWFPDCLGMGAVAWAARDLSPREALERFGFVEGGPSAAIWLQELYGIDTGHLCDIFNWRYALFGKHGSEKGITVAAALVNYFVGPGRGRGRPCRGIPSKWELIACWCRQFLGPTAFRKDGDLANLGRRMKKRVESLKLASPDIEEIRDSCAVEFSESQESTP